MIYSQEWHGEEIPWLGLRAFIAEGTGSIAGQGTRIPQAVRPKKKKNDNLTQIINKNQIFKKNEEKDAHLCVNLQGPASSLLVPMSKYEAGRTEEGLRTRTAHFSIFKIAAVENIFPSNTALLFWLERLITVAVENRVYDGDVL